LCPDKFISVEFLYLIFYQNTLWAS